jgi:hypothetical protein
LDGIWCFSARFAREKDEVYILSIKDSVQNPTHPTETLSAIKTVFEKLPGPAYSVNIENFQSWVNHEF